LRRAVSQRRALSPRVDDHHVLGRDRGRDAAPAGASATTKTSFNARSRCSR